MRMSRSPQKGGFHRCTGGGPAPRRAARGGRGEASADRGARYCDTSLPIVGAARAGLCVAADRTTSRRRGRTGNARPPARRGGQMADSDDLMPEIEATGARLVRGARDDRAAHHRPGRGRRADADRHPLRRPRPARRRAGPRQDAAGRDARHRARPRRAPGAVHAGPDAGRHPRRRGAGDRRRRHAGPSASSTARSSASC